jgi:hypothetical protein
MRTYTCLAAWAPSSRFTAGVDLNRTSTDRAFFPGPLGASDLRRSQVTVEVGLMWWIGSLEGVW